MRAAVLRWPKQRQMRHLTALQAQGQHLCANLLRFLSSRLNSHHPSLAPLVNFAPHAVGEAGVS